MQFIQEVCLCSKICLLTRRVPVFLKLLFLCFQYVCMHVVYVCPPLIMILLIPHVNGTYVSQLNKYYKFNFQPLYMTLAVDIINRYSLS